MRREHQKVNVFSIDKPDHFIGHVPVREVSANNHIRGIALPEKGLEATPPTVLR